MHNSMNAATAEINVDYAKFLDHLVKEALQASREMEISPEEALNNILECIGEDASINLESALVASNQ